MKTPIRLLAAALLLSASAFLSQGCASANAQSGLPHSMTEADARIWERQFTTARSWFNQPATDFRRTDETRTQDGRTFRLWIITKMHGTVKVYRMWLDESGKAFDAPYSNDGRIPDEPVTEGAK